jgi:hypothetical protein
MNIPLPSNMSSRPAVPIFEQRPASHKNGFFDAWRLQLLGFFVLQNYSFLLSVEVWRPSRDKTLSVGVGVLEWVTLLVCPYSVHDGHPAT